jgi:hypothetical protein
LGASLLLLSPAYMSQPKVNCLNWFMHDIDRAFSLALLNAGNSNAARMAMTAITTSSSIKVKALHRFFGFQLEEFPSYLCHSQSARRFQF